MSGAEEPEQSSSCPTAHRKWEGERTGPEKVPRVGAGTGRQDFMPNYSIAFKSPAKDLRREEGDKGISRGS